jgi:hypothetical protein
MPEQFAETVDVLNAAMEVTITLNANTASILAGGHGTSGTARARRSAAARSTGPAAASAPA